MIAFHNLASTRIVLEYSNLMREFNKNVLSRVTLRTFNPGIPSASGQCTPQPSKYI
jgi:hypothetical protein